MGLLPDVITYTNLVQHLERSGLKPFRKAPQLVRSRLGSAQVAALHGGLFCFAFSRAKVEDSIEPNLVTFNALMAASGRLKILF